VGKWRDRSPEVAAHYGGVGDGTCGVFRVRLEPRGPLILAVASSAGGWDHVSVSWPNRIPAWRDMDAIKRLFFEDDEIAVQFHINDKDKVNIHPNCLHLWRANSGLHMPTPPKEFV
jgi:hypothetical protein